MTLTEFLDRIEGVRARGSCWIARCPAHEDRSPSLSIREGDDGRILLHDFGGCTAEEIVATLGLTLADLFTDAPPPRSQRPLPKPPRIDRVAMAFQYELAALDLRLRAEKVLKAARGLGSLTDHERDRVMMAVASAHHDHERAKLLEAVADDLREKHWHERQEHHAA